MSTITKWGLITSMVYIAISLVSNLMGLQPGAGGSAALGWLVNSLTFIITFFTIYLGVKETRDEDLGGYLTLSQGFKAGLKMALIAGLIAGIFTFVYSQFIDPEMGERLLEGVEEQMDETEASEQQREMSLKITGYMVNPFIMGAFTIVWVVFWGLIKALIAGMMLKKDPPVTYPTA